MHPATINHICGMIAVVRQALSSIEAAVAAESQVRESCKVVEQPDEPQYLDEKAESALEKILGMGLEDEQSSN